MKENGQRGQCHRYDKGDGAVVDHIATTRVIMLYEGNVIALKEKQKSEAKSDKEEATDDVDDL